MEINPPREEPASTATHSWEEMARNLPRLDVTMNIGRQTIALHEGFVLEVHGTHGTVTFTPDDLCMLHKVAKDWMKLQALLTSLVVSRK